MEHLNVTFLLTNAAKNVFWVAYTFLQKPSSFKFLSISEENCVAHINNGTFKCKFLLTNASKNGLWVGYTFPQKLSSFKIYSILEENCVADIINEAFKCNTFVGKCCKKQPLSKLYLPASYKSVVFAKFFSILEENCAADINETFKCKSFVGKYCKKQPLSKSYLPTKALFFQVFQHFRRKLWCRHQ